MDFLKMPLRPGFDRVNGVYYAFDLGDFPVFAIDPGACGMTMDEAEVVTNEIVQAVNERDALVAQRDALVVALKPFAALADEIEQNPLGSARYAFDDTSLEVADCIAARATLALVKGEQKGDDADQD